MYGNGCVASLPGIPLLLDCRQQGMVQERCLAGIMPLWSSLHHWVKGSLTICSHEDPTSLLSLEFHLIVSFPNKGKFNDLSFPKSPCGTG